VKAGPTSTSCERIVTSSSRLAGPPGSIDGIQRVCSIGNAFTKPPVSDGPVSVSDTSANRRSFAARVAPNRPPASSLGPARPTPTGRVIQIDPSFFG
jgi:hypothetical protein